MVISIVLTLVIVCYPTIVIDSAHWQSFSITNYWIIHSTNMKPQVIITLFLLSRFVKNYICDKHNV